MIQIQIDEQACRGCEICIDACPTHVFAFDEKKRLPEVRKPAACFGCLACAEQCPANAIRHEGVARAVNFYYDSYALNIVTKLTGDGSHAVCNSNGGTIQKGIDDLGVRLLSLAAVLRSTLSSLVCRRSGPSLAELWPGSCPATRFPRTSMRCSHSPNSSSPQRGTWISASRATFFKSRSRPVTCASCARRRKSNWAEISAHCSSTISPATCIVWANFGYGSNRRPVGLRVARTKRRFTRETGEQLPCRSHRNRK